MPPPIILSEQMSKLRAYPTAKKAALGKTGGTSPVWKAQVAAAQRQGFRPLLPETGSKILVSQLPLDVGEPELDELFSATIGPLLDVFVIYNKLSQSKGMAVVHFKSPSDAKRARDRYNGKVIDGRVPIKIEYITDVDSSPLTLSALPVSISRPRTLIERMGIQLDSVASQPPRQINGSFVSPIFQYGMKIPVVTTNRAYVYGNSKKIRKGPRRARKQARPIKSLSDLDKEMDEYRRESKFPLGSPPL